MTTTGKISIVCNIPSRQALKQQANLDLTVEQYESIRSHMEVYLQDQALMTFAHFLNVDKVTLSTQAKKVVKKPERKLPENPEKLNQIAAQVLAKTLED